MRYFHFEVDFHALAVKFCCKGLDRGWRAFQIPEVYEESTRRLSLRFSSPLNRKYRFKDPKIGKWGNSKWCSRIKSVWILHLNCRNSCGIAMLPIVWSVYLNRLYHFCALSFTFTIDLKKNIYIFYVLISVRSRTVLSSTSFISVSNPKPPRWSKDMNSNLWYEKQTLLNNLLFRLKLHHAA